MVWASRWSVAHSIGKFFLCYIIRFSSETSAPGSPGNYLYTYNIYIYIYIYTHIYIYIYIIVYIYLMLHAWSFLVHHPSPIPFDQLKESSIAFPSISHHQQLLTHIFLQNGHVSQVGWEIPWLKYDDLPLESIRFVFSS